MSTTHRHLETLVDRGSLVKEAEEYRLSLQSLEQGSSPRTGGRSTD